MRAERSLVAPTDTYLEGILRVQLAVDCLALLWQTVHGGADTITHTC